MTKVAFICVHNSCRSQIAEALGKSLAADVFESYSAGTKLKEQIDTDAVRLMKQLYGIDMLMMLQFSYCCEYYKERFQIYCGEDVLSRDDRVVAELLKFFESAFTTEQSQIAHRR